MNDILRPTSRLRPLLLLGVVLLVAGAVRTYKLGAHPLWLDEFFSLQCANGLPRTFEIPNQWLENPPDVAFPQPGATASRVWRSVLTTSHPPGYFLALHAWLQVFHGDEVRIRMLSVLFSLVAIGALFVAVRRWMGDGPAVWACLIVALAEQDLFIAKFVRAYAMLMMFGMLSLAVLAGIEKVRATLTRGVLLAICLLGMAMSHYSAAGALGAITLYAVIGLRGRARKVSVLAILAAVVIFAGAWGPFMLQQASFAQDGSWLADPATGIAKRTILRALVAPAKLLTSSPSVPRVAAMGFTALLIVVPLLALRRRRDLLIWWLWLIVIVAGVAASDLAGHLKQLAQPRYIAMATPAVAVLVASLATRRAWWRLLPVAVVLLVCVIALPRSINNPFYRHNAQHLAMGKFLGSRVLAGDVIVFAGTPPNALELSGIRDTYVHYADRKPAKLAQLDVSSPSPLLAEVQKAPRVWVVAAHEDEDKLPLIGQANEQWSFKDLCLIQLIEIK